MGFVLFGHSYVKRLKNKRGSIVHIELQRGSIPITCLGEGGLNFERIQARPDQYFPQLRNAQPSILVMDLGTNDLCSHRGNPSAIFHTYCDFVNEFQKWGISPDVIVFLQVLHVQVPCAEVRCLWMGLIAGLKSLINF